MEKQCTGKHCDTNQRKILEVLAESTSAPTATCQKTVISVDESTRAVQGSLHPQYPHLDSSGHRSENSHFCLCLHGEQFKGSFPSTNQDSAMIAAGISQNDSSKTHQCGNGIICVSPK